MKKIFLILMITVFAFSFWSCKKKEEQPAVSQEQKMPTGPIIDSQAGGPPHGVTPPKTEFKVVVPDEVKAMWTGVKIIVDDKKENKKQEFTVAIGSEFKIPDSKLTVKVGPFLPDFKMNESTITSASNEPNNPSVGVSVTEGDNKIFPPSGEWGWLYAKFPNIHSFQHERFSLELKEAMKK